ncbi:hypothetical protein P7K49_003570, partial [Saguinus oedipus]
SMVDENGFGPVEIKVHYSCVAANTELSLGQGIVIGVRSEQDQHLSDSGESKLR